MNRKGWTVSEHIARHCYPLLVSFVGKRNIHPNEYIQGCIGLQEYIPEIEFRHWGATELHQTLDKIRLK